MALATQCPHCQTTFRVANDQLKLHGGLVRCGSCKQTFNGIEHLIAPGAPRTNATAKKSAPSSPEMQQVKQAIDFDATFVAPANLTPTPPISTLAERTPATPATPATPVAPVATTAATSTIAETIATQTTFQNTTENAEQNTEKTATKTPAINAVEEQSSAVSPSTIEVSIEGLALDATDFAPTAESPVQPEAATTATAQAASDLTSPSLSQKPNTAQRVSANSLEFDLSENGEASKAETEQAEDIDLSQLSDQEAETTLAPSQKAATSQTTAPIDTHEETLPIDLSSTVSMTQAAEIEASLDGSAAHADEEHEPNFIIQAKKSAARRRIGTVLFSLGTLILLFGLAAQIAYSARVYIAANFPESKPYLLEGCKLLHCKIALPMQIHEIALESNELQALSQDRNLYSLSVLLQNKSSTLQTWPLLELVLNDAKDRPVLRRIFGPADYLTKPAEISKGFAANGEQSIKLHFELSKPSAAGYRVGIFYP